MLLLTAASIASDLDDAVARLLKRGSGGRRAETEAPLPVDLTASNVRALLRLVIAGWAARITTRDDQIPEVRGTDGYRDMAALARFVAGHIDRARQHPDAAEQLARTRTAVNRALVTIDRAPERAPAGLCDNCGRQLLAELGAESVTCACGMTALALQDKRRERAAAADVLGTPEELSAVLDKLGVKVKPGTISAWGTRGQIEKVAGGFYRLSDALAMAAKIGTRRARLANLT